MTPLTFSLAFFHQKVVCYGLAWPSANVGRQHVGARYGHLCAPTFEYWHCSEKSCNKHNVEFYAQNKNRMKLNPISSLRKSLSLMPRISKLCSRQPYIALETSLFSIPTLKDRSLLAFTAFQGYWMHFFLAVSMSCTVLTEEVAVVVAMLASQLAFRANKAFVNNEQQSWRRLR